MLILGWFWCAVGGCTEVPPTSDSVTPISVAPAEDSGSPAADDTNQPDTGDSPDTGEDTEPVIPGIRLESESIQPCEEPSLRTDMNKMKVSTDTVWSELPVGSQRFTGFGVTAGDFNADGWDDFFFADNPAALVLSDSTGLLVQSFTLPVEIVDDAIGSVAGDVDGDGDLDLYIYGYGINNNLWLNDGLGTFTDATATAGFDGANEAGTSHASMGDLDGDGDLDLVVGNGRTITGPNPSDVGLLSQVYENLGDGVFTDRSDVLTVEQRHGYNWIFSLFDVDADGDLDMYQVLDFASYSWTNILLRNDGDWTFTDVSEETHTNLSMDGMGLAVGDMNGDGIPEMAIPDWGPDAVSVLESDGLGGWYESSASRGIIEDFTGGSVVGWGTEFVDIDNDRDLDLYMAFGEADCGSVGCPLRENPLKQKSELWIQTDEHFYPDGRAHSLNRLGSWRGGVFVDLNRDGWLDLVQERLELNPLAHMGICGTEHSIQVRLRNTGPNTHGVGAHITATTGDQVQHKWLLAGSTGHANSGPSWVHFGLGSATSIDELTINWPDGHTTALRNVEADQILTVYRESVE